MKRVQYKRGQKLPPNTKLVSRSSRWGNPYRVDEWGREMAITKYHMWLILKIEREWNFLGPLIGYDLACYCSLDKDCHADILLEMLE